MWTGTRGFFGRMVPVIKEDVMKSHTAVLVGILVSGFLLGMALLSSALMGDPEGATFSAVAAEEANNMMTVAPPPGGRAGDALLVLSGWLVFVIVLYSWVSWTEREQGLLSSGSGQRDYEAQGRKDLCGTGELTGGRSSL